jgi:hypothetical protein
VLGQNKKVASRKKQGKKFRNNQAQSTYKDGRRKEVKKQKHEEVKGRKNWARGAF